MIEKANEVEIETGLEIGLSIAGTVFIAILCILGAIAIIVLALEKLSKSPNSRLYSIGIFSLNRKAKLEQERKEREQILRNVIQDINNSNTPNMRGDF